MKRFIYLLTLSVCFVENVFTCHRTARVTRPTVAYVRNASIAAAAVKRSVASLAACTAATVNVPLARPFAAAQTHAGMHTGPGSVTKTALPKKRFYTTGSSENQKQSSEQTSSEHTSSEQKRSYKKAIAAVLGIMGAGIGLGLSLDINENSEEEHAVPVVVDTLPHRLGLLFERSGLSIWVDRRLRKQSQQQTDMLLEASEHYQELARNAYEKLGVSPAKRVPIKSMCIYKENAAASTTPSCIIIHERLLNGAPYGCQRTTLLHEAQHRNSLDAANQTIIKESPPFIYVGLSSALYGIMILASKRPGPSPKLLKTLLAGGIAGAACAFRSLFSQNSSWFSKRYNTYAERQADVKACYASECSACVGDFARARGCPSSEHEEKIKAEGYLVEDEILPIADELAVKGRYCEKHKSGQIVYVSEDGTIICRTKDGITHIYKPSEELTITS